MNPPAPKHKPSVHSRPPPLSPFHPHIHRLRGNGYCRPSNAFATITFAAVCFWAWTEGDSSRNKRLWKLIPNQMWKWWLLVCSISIGVPSSMPASVAAPLKGICRTVSPRCIMDGRGARFSTRKLDLFQRRSWH